MFRKRYKQKHIDVNKFKMYLNAVAPKSYDPVKAQAICALVKKKFMN